jgi:lipid-A-disaccharide synthase
VAYRVNPFSALAFRLLARTPYVNLVNVLLGREAVPELLQGRCTSFALAAAVANLLPEGEERGAQRQAFQEALRRLRPPGSSPSRLAAQTVLAMAGGA